MTAAVTDSAIATSSGDYEQTQTVSSCLYGYYEKISSLVASIWNRASQSLTSLYQKATSFIFSSRHSFFERIFRTSYFRIAAISDGWVEKEAYRLYLSMSKSTCSPAVFDGQRAERSLSLFKAIGTTTAQVIPNDGKASIQMMNLKAKDFEHILKGYGAKWEKKELRTVEGKPYTAFVIIPNPANTAWKSFAEDILTKFNWKEEELTQTNGEKLRGIVTSENADLITEPDSPKVFFFCHSPSSSFIYERTRAAYYLGMKQDVCMYDNRGIWKSTGSPTEAGFYLDAEKVLEELLHTHSYSLADIWVGGKCSGAHVAAHLKAKYHEQGLNFFAEGSFINVRRDFVSSLDPISRYVYDRCVRSIKMDPQSPAVSGIKEVDFDIERLWEGLSLKAQLGKVVLIHAVNDQRLAKEAHLAFEALAAKVNAHTQSILFTSQDLEDPHADMCLNYADVKREFAKSIFVRSS